MKSAFFISVCWIIIITSSCSKEHSYAISQNDTTSHTQIDTPVHNLSLKIAVVSDIHYMDPSLLVNNADAGIAFQTYLQYDPKLVEYSDPIFRAVIAQLITEKPDVLLIPGDLTKDGEKISHKTMAGLLRDLANAHIKVFVVPGNHDINNPNARAYDGDKALTTPSISANEFSTIYSAFGYGNALSRDSGSLSYLNQADSNLWILAIDDCEYEDNKNFPIVGGRIKEATMKWALGWIKEAKNRHIHIYGMMHHNMIEHYAGEAQLDPGYVTDNWEEEADEFINAGLSVIFTGHYHANDITKRITGGKELYDIETGSLINEPIPYRIIDIKNSEFDITTNFITSISVSLPGGSDLKTYADLFLSQHLDSYFGTVLSKPPYSLPAATAAVDASLFRNAFMAHFAGDESISPQEKAKDDSLGHLSPLAGGVLSTLWTDINTSDNNVIIKFAVP